MAGAALLASRMAWTTASSGDLHSTVHGLTILTHGQCMLTDC